MQYRGLFNVGWKTGFLKFFNFCLFIPKLSFIVLSDNELGPGQSDVSVLYSSTTEIDNNKQWRSTIHLGEEAKLSRKWVSTDKKKQPRIHSQIVDQSASRNR